MSLLFKQLFGFFRLLHSDTGTNQIAAGLALGLILGFSPLLSLQGFLLILILLFFRIQIGAAFVSAFFFSFVAYLLDPMCDLIGRWILEHPALRPTFVTLYNLPIVPLTRFNNSIIMGSGIISFLLAIPAFFVFRSTVVQYRVTVVQKIQNSKVWAGFQATTFYQWYSKFNDLYGA